MTLFAHRLHRAALLACRVDEQGRVEIAPPGSLLQQRVKEICSSDACRTAQGSTSYPSSDPEEAHGGHVEHVFALACRCGPAWAWLGQMPGEGWMWQKDAAAEPTEGAAEGRPFKL